MPARRLLVVVYPYPPVPSVGGNRWAAAGRHLARMGHEVTVLSTSAYGELPAEEGVEVIRTADLNSARALRALLRRPDLPVVGERLPASDKPAPSLLTRVVVPDAFALSWAPAALRVARRLIRERSVDCLITSSPFESTHLVGLALGRSRPAWLADFRDGWTFEPLRPPFPTAIQTALDVRLERAVVRGADAVVGATPPIADDLSRRFGVPTAYVPNGWDPDLEPDGSIGPVVLDPDRVTLVHTGGMSNRGDARPLFEALRRLAKADAEAARRLDLVMAGRVRPDEEALIASAPAAVRVRHVGMLPREQALALQRRASALLLLTSRQSSEGTGKLFEYLAAGRPIVALAAGNVAAQIVRETRTGVLVAPDDPEAIAGVLRRVANGELSGEYAPRGLERYRFPGIAQALASEIEHAIAHRADSRA